MPGRPTGWPEILRPSNHHHIRMIQYYNEKAYRYKKVEIWHVHKCNESIKNFRKIHRDAFQKSIKGYVASLAICAKRRTNAHSKIVSNNFIESVLIRMPVLDQCRYHRLQLSHVIMVPHRDRLLRSVAMMDCHKNSPYTSIHAYHH